MRSFKDLPLQENYLKRVIATGLCVYLIGDGRQAKPHSGNVFSSAKEVVKVCSDDLQARPNLLAVMPFQASHLILVNFVSSRNLIGIFILRWLKSHRKFIN